ncbi:MAG: hypothetical protein WCG19_11455 [Chlorobiaceae bacterium]
MRESSIPTTGVDLPKGLTQSDVEYLYRWLLHRSPESQEIVDAYLTSVKSRADLVEIIVNSDEFRGLSASHTSLQANNPSPLLDHLANIPLVVDLLIEGLVHRRVSESKNPLNKFGRKVFSQSDEDGITLEISRRLGVQNGSYCEFGVGNGLECNTLMLASMQWKGFWIGGEELAFSLTDINKSKFSYIQEWVTSQNVFALYQEGLRNLGRDQIDVLSFDLDGNDLWFVEILLQNNVKPKLFIVEYNARFIPPIKWSIALDDAHKWDFTDYSGASLQSFVDLFALYGYTLVCCNAHSGVNAFFVLNEYLPFFQDVPKNIDDIYMSPNYKIYRAYAHPVSPKTAVRIFSRL